MEFESVKKKYDDFLDTIGELEDLELIEALIIADINNIKEIIDYIETAETTGFNRTDFIQFLVNIHFMSKLNQL